MHSILFGVLLLVFSSLAQSACTEETMFDNCSFPKCSDGKWTCRNPNTACNNSNKPSCTKAVCSINLPTPEWICPTFNLTVVKGGIKVQKEIRNGLEGRPMFEHSLDDPSDYANIIKQPTQNGEILFFKNSDENHDSGAVQTSDEKGKRTTLVIGSKEKDDNKSTIIYSKTLQLDTNGKLIHQTVCSESNADPDKCVAASPEICSKFSTDYFELREKRKQCLDLKTHIDAILESSRVTFKKYKGDISADYGTLKKSNLTKNDFSDKTSEKSGGIDWIKNPFGKKKVDAKSSSPSNTDVSFDGMANLSAMCDNLKDEGYLEKTEKPITVPRETDSSAHQ